MHKHKLKMDTHEPFAYCDCGVHIWKSEIERILNSHADLLEALEDMLKALDTALRASPNSEVSLAKAFSIVGAKERANKAIERAK